MAEMPDVIWAGRRIVEVEDSDGTWSAVDSFRNDSKYLRADGETVKALREKAEQSAELARLKMLVRKRHLTAHTVEMEIVTADRGGGDYDEGWAYGVIGHIAGREGEFILGAGSTELEAWNDAMMKEL